MKCKNCGAKLKDNTEICPNCGAFIDSEKGYVLSTDDDAMFDISATVDEDDEEAPVQKKKGRGFIRFLSLLLTLLIIGAGAYYYFTKIYQPKPDKPELTFVTGSGVINDDEEIIYVLLDEKSNIEFIHGVSIYDYDKTDKQAEKKGAVSTDYEYTKNIDSTFRAIFFDVDKLGELGTENTYTFEMSFSFYNSDKVYTYEQPITFSSQITDEASDLIFDHTLTDEQSEKKDESTTDNAETTTKAPETTAASGGMEFVYDSYWFTQPVQNGNEYIIAAIKINRDRTYTTTNYYKNGDSSWELTTHSGKYTVENGFIVIDNGEATESTFYKIDTKNQTLYEEENGEKTAELSARKYNSIKNAEDFFGI